MSGKGDSRRPAAVPRATVDANYERTFTKHPALGAPFEEQDRYAPPGVRYVKFEDIPEMPGGGFAYECRTPSGRADASE